MATKTPAKSETPTPAPALEAPATTPSPEKPADLSPVASSAPGRLTAEQQAAIDKIMADAKRSAEQVILGGNSAAAVGTPSGNIEDKVAQTQRDHVPGRLRKDKTYVPTRVYDQNEDVDRDALRPNDYKYALVTQDDFFNYRNMGYKLCLYDGGNQSGLTPRGFLGTGDTVFTRTVLGYCQRGDVFLMYIPIKGWEALREEDAVKMDGETNRAIGSFYNAGYREGIRPTAEINGKSIV